MRRSDFKAGPCGFVEWTTLVWFMLDALTHLSIELAYLYLALGVTAAKSDTWMGHIWREYGRADKRWAVRDSTVIALELLTVFVMGPLALWAAYAIYYRKPYRHVLQLSISVCELYGGFMTFVPDILDGAPNLAIGDPVLLWVHLVFMNGVWVLVPAILVIESAAQLTHACSVAKTEERPNRELTRGLPSVFWFQLIAGTLVAYVVLVPLVVLVTANPPPAVS